MLEHFVNGIHETTDSSYLRHTAITLDHVQAYKVEPQLPAAM